MFLIHEVFAQAADSAVAVDAGGPSPALMLGLEILVIGFIFWTLIIRPQSQRAKQHQSKLDALKKGDRVVTGGGVIGTVVKADTAEVTVEIADGVRIRVVRGTIGDVMAEDAK